MPGGRFALDPVSGEWVETMLRAFEEPDLAGTPPERLRRPDQRAATRWSRPPRSRSTPARPPTPAGTRFPLASDARPAGNLLHDRPVITFGLRNLIPRVRAAKKLRFGARPSSRRRPRVSS
jgi:hypothetical protein